VVFFRFFLNIRKIMGYRESVAMLLDYIVLLFNEYFTI
jgi:hypothetical protein